MAADSEGMSVVIMGVSGAGKSTIGEMLAKAVNCSFLDADDFHPQSNKALQKQYREILRSADSNYVPGSYICVVKFVLLDARAEVLAARLQKRAEEGNHFMPAKLLQSQLDLLQIDDLEGIVKVDATLSPPLIVDTIKALFFRHL